MTKYAAFTESAGRKIAEAAKWVRAHGMTGHRYRRQNRGGRARGTGSNGSNLTDCGCGNTISQLLGIDAECAAMLDGWNAAETFTVTAPELNHPGLSELSGAVIEFTHVSGCVWESQEFDLTCAGVPETSSTTTTTGTTGTTSTTGTTPGEEEDTETYQFVLTLVAQTEAGVSVQPAAKIELVSVDGGNPEIDCGFYFLATSSHFVPNSGGLFRVQDANCIEWSGCFCVDALGSVSDLFDSCVVDECEGGLIAVVDGVEDGDGMTGLDKFNQRWPFSAADRVQFHPDQAMIRSGANYGCDDPDGGGLVLLAGEDTGVSGAIHATNGGDIGVGFVLIVCEGGGYRIDFLWDTVGTHRLLARYTAASIAEDCADTVLTLIAENYGEWPATITVTRGVVTSIDVDGNGITEKNPCTGPAADDSTTTSTTGTTGTSGSTTTTGTTGSTTTSTTTTSTTASTTTTSSTTEATGRCCYWDGMSAWQCTVATEAECDTLQGEYEGGSGTAWAEGGDCTGDDPCGVERWCCVEGECSPYQFPPVGELNSCTEVGGTSWETEVECEEECEPPTGSCCWCSGGELLCDAGVTEAWCLANRPSPTFTPGGECATECPEFTPC